jgi:cytoskeletal protein CcmA (bactofilin family)
MNLFGRGDEAGEKAGDNKTTEKIGDKPADKVAQPAPQNFAPLKAATPPEPPKPAPQPVVSAAPQPVEAPRPAPVVTPPAPTITTTNLTATNKGAPMASVISKALKITGELESTEDIQIDGQIDGDVRGVGVKIGQHAKVTGTVYGDDVELAGTIEGKIEAKKVTISGTARMTGDIWFQDIKIDSGAYVSGNLKPELGKQGAGAAKPADIKPAAKPSATVSTLNSPSPASASTTAHAN